MHWVFGLYYHNAGNKCKTGKTIKKQIHKNLFKSRNCTGSYKLSKLCSTLWGCASVKPVTVLSCKEPRGVTPSAP